MTALEIILTIVLLNILVTSYFVIKWFRIRHTVLMSEYEANTSLMKDMASKGLFNNLLDVDRFNEWFNSPKDSSIYAHPGIFLRTDKLSQGHIEDYIYMTTCGILTIDYFEYNQIVDFEHRILNDWFKKLEK